MRTERGVSAPCHSGPSGDTARWSVLREIPNFIVIARIGSSSARWSRRISGQPSTHAPIVPAWFNQPGSQR